MAIIDEILCKWRGETLKTISSYVDKSNFVLQNEIQLKLLGVPIPMNKAISKGLDADFKSRILTVPTAQRRYTDLCEEYTLEWKEVYDSKPFSQVSQSQENFNINLETKTLLKKICKMDSSVCSFFGTVDESLQHLFPLCLIISTFCSDLIGCSKSINIKIKALSVLDILFGLWKRKEDYLLMNHIIIIANQYIYYCRNNILKPSLTVHLSKLDSVYHTESRIANTNNRLSIHSLKWDKYVIYLLYYLFIYLLFSKRFYLLC